MTDKPKTPKPETPPYHELEGYGTNYLMVGFFVMFLVIIAASILAGAG